MEYNFSEQFITKKELNLEVKNLKDFVDVSNFIDGDNFFVISYEKSVVVSGDLNSRKQEKSQQIIHKTMLDDIFKNPMKIDEIKSKYEYPVVVYKKGFGEFAKAYGTSCQTYLGENAKTIKDFIITDINNALQLKDCEIYQFLPNKNYLRVFKDVNGEYITDPILLNYCDGNLDNGEYHLDELVEYLSERKDISFIVSTKDYSDKYSLLKCPLSGKEEGVNRIIENIPGYNSEPGKDETINIVFYPDSEQIKNFIDWDYESSKTKKIYDCKSFIVKEILDCDKFSKQPIIANQVVPKRKFKS